MKGEKDLQKTPKFFRCKVCGNIIEKIYDSGVPVVGCGEEMEELVANTVDASKEKHTQCIHCWQYCSLMLETCSILWKKSITSCGFTSTPRRVLRGRICVPG